MNHTFEITGFYEVLNKLADCAITEKAKKNLKELMPILNEGELRKSQRTTAQARKLIEQNGNPPIPAMDRIEEFLDKSMSGELLEAEQIGSVGGFLNSVGRLKSYLERGKDRQISLAYYADNLSTDEELTEEIARSVRDGRVDDYATKTLADARKQIQVTEEKIREKAETALRTNKAYVSDNFVVSRNGHVCIPVKKQFRGKVAGTVIDTSGAGSTVFVEPKTVSTLRDELEILKLAEDEEERRILYTIMAEIADREPEMRENIRIIVMLDEAFARGKLGIDMGAVEPEINTEGRIQLKGARHPGLKKEECVPLDFKIGGKIRGVVITGPNTGGKTVSIKTVALMNLMATSGLQVPAEKADIAMRNQVLCDIGDGQSMNDNLSTFSSHIKNVISILRKVTEESLVILDELGSGTDPAEGMGIAVAILEELRKSGTLFLVTTHYPEVKTYAEGKQEIQNARMAFDRESLKPLYRMEQGKSGDSCALYIAERLGLPEEMLRTAAEAAYGADETSVAVKAGKDQKRERKITHEHAPKIQKIVTEKKTVVHGEQFARGDSVMVSPEGKVGIVVAPADATGEVLVQIQKEKRKIRHTRLRLLVKADRLYPEDYDFSIVFDSVELRKMHHKMERKYVEEDFQVE